MNTLPDALPQLAVGTHQRGTGKACIMNAISYLNGDSKITDLPSCTDPVLATLAQMVNDSLCRHRLGDLLCSDCSHVMWRLGVRLIGTADRAGAADSRENWLSWLRVCHAAIEVRRDFTDRHYIDQYPGGRNACTALGEYLRTGELPHPGPALGLIVTHIKIGVEWGKLSPLTAWKTLIEEEISRVKGVLSRSPGQMPTGIYPLLEALHETFKLVEAAESVGQRGWSKQSSMSLWRTEKLRAVLHAALYALPGQHAERGFEAVLDAFEREFGAADAAPDPSRLVVLQDEINGQAVRAR